MPLCLGPFDHDIGQVLKQTKRFVVCLLQRQCLSSQHVILVCRDVIKTQIDDFLNKICTQCKIPCFERSLQVLGRYTNKCKRYCCSKFEKYSYIFCGSYVGGQKNAHRLIFPYNVIEHSPTSLACNSVFVGPNDFKFGTNTRCVVW